MATRKVILTERELTNLIKRIVRETEEMDSKKATKSDVVDALGGFFSKYKSKLRSDKEDIMSVADDFKSEEMNERYLQEGDEDEDDNINSRKSSFKEKLMKTGGFTMAALGLVGFIGRSMGWSEFETTTKIYEYIEQFGAGNYSGPITVAMIVAGLGIAFRGMVNKYNRENR
jgi:hypothetical protein